MDRYAELFDRLAGEGAFGAFFILGYPNLKASAEILDALVDGGADMIEVGIPFSDPVADGPVIQAAAVQALRQGVTPSDCFALLQAFRQRHPNVPVGILTYANLVVARGLNAFYADAAHAGVDSVLIADVPLFEVEPFAAAALDNGTAPVLIAAPNTPDRTLERIAAVSKGYTYCVSRSGVTGADEQVQFSHSKLFEKLRSFGAPPPVLGFGISKPEHVRAGIEAGAAGVISGSAIVRLAESETEAPTRIADFVRQMKAATRYGCDMENSAPSVFIA
ncbi:MAG TPA: tryptophan synthase subunit alpha [Sphingomicrobium sp.]|nr:tryptophan synthase subunit alpha [Sphingomicrobium sp.]